MQRLFLRKLCQNDKSGWKSLYVVSYLCVCASGLYFFQMFRSNKFSSHNVYNEDSRLHTRRHGNLESHNIPKFVWNYGVFLFYSFCI
jgi:hypothetical protein